MKNSVETSAEYWQGVLNAGGNTKVPRWTCNSSAALGEHADEYELPVSDRLATKLRRVADEFGVPMPTLLLAAHAKVLAVMSGELAVTAGYMIDANGPPLPCRMSVVPATWREFVRSIYRREQELIAHSGFSLQALAQKMELALPAFDTVFDPSGALDVFDGRTALSVGLVLRGSSVALRVRYRVRAFDAENARRIAGYHLTALALMSADPDQEHESQSLVSKEERQYQIERFAGPRRELPNQRFHELFEQRVASHPDAVAATCGDRKWTYRELNERANQIGRALLARGLGREDVVAVVMQRDLDWMASVLAIFKAGGVYLPIEPHFPAERIENMLSRAQCKLALSERGSDATLNETLAKSSQTERLYVGLVYDEGHGVDNLDIPVSAQQAAYIYFTSGSTGKPKGAMCEHAGMLNHLLAKIEDLEIGEGQVVAQIAPQCFDISLWQLVCALLVGGRTLVVEQDVVLDINRFVETIVKADVSVMQVVPSYLEALLTYFEQHDVALSDLHCVSVTGEAVTNELTQRWFSAMPAAKLANAYGLTETCDDTNHEVMDRAPEGSRVPLGRCVRNVHVYVVDRNLFPVPLGAPGEIVFSGMCVGRGYINDPERTRQAFVADPLREGERLYRSGDYGRWRPDGKLEFLGRQDAQVKIRGFRIEIGDVESSLLRVPGVTSGAVVVTEREGGNKQLVAFYSGEEKVSGATLEESLAGALPAYMVPSAFHWQETMPLTANGKIDKKCLKELALTLEAGDATFEAPVTPEEKRLATAWAKVLGVDAASVGRNDHFIDQGGTSLSAVKLVVALGNKVPLKTVIQNPVLCDLAKLLRESSGSNTPLRTGPQMVDLRRAG